MRYSVPHANNDEMRALADHRRRHPWTEEPDLAFYSLRDGPRLRKFSEANVAIYPVDLDGVCGGPTTLGSLPAQGPES